MREKLHLYWPNKLEIAIFYFPTFLIMMISVPSSICHWTWIGNWKSLLEQIHSTLGYQLLWTKLWWMMEPSMCISYFASCDDDVSREKLWQWVFHLIYALYPKSWQRIFYLSLYLFHNVVGSLFGAQRRCFSFDFVHSFSLSRLRTKI